MKVKVTFSKMASTIKEDFGCRFLIPHSTRKRSYLSENCISVGNSVIRDKRVSE